jgi:hypothetical protein
MWHRWKEVSSIFMVQTEQVLRHAIDAKTGIDDDQTIGNN